MLPNWFVYCVVFPGMALGAIGLLTLVWLIVSDILDGSCD